MSKIDDLLSKVVGALAAQKVEVNTSGDAQRYSRLKGAVVLIIGAMLGEDRIAEVLPVIDKIANGDEDAISELHRLRVVNVTVDAGHARNKIAAPHEPEGLAAK
jgi:hypothetical protein